MTNYRTAGIIIIGNEILSGKVKDANSFYLASELRELGVDVRRISVIPDVLDVIGEEVVRFSENFDHVFTSGGVGPTHDDVTMAGIAKGFGVKLIEHPEIKKILQSKYDVSLNSAVLKMTKVPEGSIVEYNEAMRFPIVSYKNIYIFPGIPEYIKNKFSSIREKFRSSSFYLKRLYLKCQESSIAGILGKVVSECSGVDFGSYPVLGISDYSVVITVESKSEDVLNTAFNSLTDALPGEIIVRTE
jgi:molybdenum cofactor synthesis domain-containing protein